MLPKINETAYTALTIPSTGKVFNFRPYLVSEEKVLLLAMESADEATVLDAIKNTLMACCQETLVVDRLALFDFEYLFAQVRAASVGQTTTIRMKCDAVNEEGVACNGLTDVDVDISSITIEVNDADKTIELTPEHTLTMRWPSYRDGINIVSKQKARDAGETSSAVEDMFDLISTCIVSVQSSDSIHNFDEESKEDIDAWLNALKADQLNMIMNFVKNVPTLHHPIPYKCEKCGSDQETILEGLSDFF